MWYVCIYNYVHKCVFTYIFKLSPPETWTTTNPAMKAPRARTPGSRDSGPLADGADARLGGGGTVSVEYPDRQRLLGLCHKDSAARLRGSHLPNLGQLEPQQGAESQ